MKWQIHTLVTAIPFLSGEWGLWGAYLRAHGDGYTQNQSASGMNVGLAADGRMGLRFSKLRIWAALSLYRWAFKETIRVDSLSTDLSRTSNLPA
jgi:hypothetical protein